MIKTKEDLHKTFFCASETEIPNKIQKILNKPFILNTHPTYISVRNGRVSWMPEYTEDGISSEEWYAENGYRKITIADFEPEEEKVTSEKKYPVTKEDLLGTKVRISSREQWDRLKELYESVGCEHADWEECDFNETTTTLLCGREGYFLATYRWEDTPATSEEFRNLREVEYEDLFETENQVSDPEDTSTPKYKYTEVKVDSIFELKELFEEGKLYFRWLGNPEKGSGGVGYDRITEEDMLICRYEEGRLLVREEVKWQDEVVNFLLTITTHEDDVDQYDWRVGSSFLTDSEFLEAARIALKATGELK